MKRTCYKMKKNGLYSVVFLLLLLIVPLDGMAAWQVSNPKSSAPQDPFFQTGSRRLTAQPVVGSTHHAKYPSEYASYSKPATVYGVSVSGSLKENLERIMKRYHWRVVWKAPFDYNFDGKITGSSLPNVVQKLLQPFPLQAVMYQSNRTVAVVSRQIR